MTNLARLCVLNPISRRSQQISTLVRAIVSPAFRSVLAIALGPCLVLGFSATPIVAQTSGSSGLAVSVARPTKRCFDDRVDVTGVLVARQDVDVRPDRDGLRVVQVFAEALDDVKIGQALAQLAPDSAGAGTATVTVRAPVGGIIGRSTAVAGAPAPVRAEPLFQIVVGGEIELEAGVPIARMESIASGQPVLVKPLGERVVSGQVRLVSAMADRATQRGQVRVLIDRHPELRLGMFARGTITVGQRCGMAVPFSSLLTGPEGVAVYVAIDNRVEARPVTTGLSSDTEIEIRSGLAEGDLVVVRAGPFLREGDLVRPVTTRTAPPT